MILRPANELDAAGVAYLEQELFGFDAWSLPAVVAELAGGDRLTVAVCEGELVGYAMTLRTGDVVDLQRIGVHGSHRRKGFARDLLAAALTRAVADGADRMLLEVSAANTAAVACYAAQGFVEIHRRRRYYRDGSDAIVMRRSLGRAACGGGG